MALTMLDPKTALIVVDLQKEIVGLPLVHSYRRGRRAARAWPTPSASTACR